jgi:ligand-binding sensor domain-containing protein
MSANKVRISLALGALVPALVAATTLMPIEVQPESKLWIAGTSTVRAFQCQAATFDAKLGATGTNAVSAVLAGEKAVSDIVVTVPAE